ncbi:unnamed protein product [Aspergillus oryzae RIB40]|uniref:DNA, SC010 n=1 Tax=Aspergillus oryzae (strain ATCC 42149 / RIB 40) TaxID=510516 RepID=Q2TW29_ASPOR|nr:LOW QUALITY PROTEIN: unnamed protein product [Aspergillus oryzae RIB40]BAE66544.1 unnamed protein product [Aspergillus oryzae RIB40]
MQGLATSATPSLAPRRLRFINVLHCSNTPPIHALSLPLSLTVQATKLMMVRTTEYKAEYHHFIPRFLLRHPRATPPTRRQRGRRPRSQRPQWQPPKDPFVNAIDLRKNALVQVSVSREFGLVDMYRDQGYQNPRHIEDNLGKLEGHAGRIIKKASDTFKAGQTLELTRRERDTIRKFLFLMKYRNSTFYARYNHDSIMTYDSNDKHRLESYMREKRFKSPRDIWYSNLKTFLDLEMDPDMQWIKKVHERAFPDDAMMFIHHMQSKFMAFCQPSSEEDEFILTHNAYGVFEGPSDVQIDPTTGGAIEGAYTEYHNFAPISAKLIIILRSSLLVDPSKEGAEDLQEEWENLREEVRKQHLFPDKAAVSLLESLPIKKCGNSYSTTINGKLVLKPNRGPRGEDKFYFTCFRISSYYVSLINSIFLEQATKGDTIVYRSKSALGRTLKSYLEIGREGFKLVTDEANDPHLAFLKKLEKIAGQLVGNVCLRYKAIAPPKPQTHMSQWVAHLVGLKVMALSGNSAAPEVYKLMKPDGGLDTYFYDLMQSQLMVFLKIKIDVILSRSKLTQDDRLEVKYQLLQLYLTFPAQRLWLYVKIMRNLPNFDERDFKKPIRELEINGPEDDVAKYQLTMLMFYKVQMTASFLI